MRFYLFGPRIMGVRPGISLTPEDLRPRTKAIGEPMQGSFVYVIRGDHNMSKIGVTTNPTARIAQLRTGSAFPIGFAFIGCTPGTGFDIEADAHSLLSRQRCAGEWFDVSPELAISAVTGAAARLGQPLLSTDERTAAKGIQIAAQGAPVDRSEEGVRLFVEWVIVSAVIIGGMIWIFWKE